MWTAAKVNIDIVTAAPPILIVAPSGIETEYVSLSRPNSSQSSIFTGILAAELLVKNAVSPLSFKHLNTSGYGFFLIPANVIKGFTTKAIKAITPTSKNINCKYAPKALIPLVAKLSNTNPIIPRGAKFITHLTTWDRASDTLLIIVFVLSFAFLRASPNTTAHANIPI